MEKKTFRKPNSIHSHSVAEPTGAERASGKRVIRSYSVDEEENLTGRSLIGLKERDGDDPSEVENSEEDSYGSSDTLHENRIRVDQPTRGYGSFQRRAEAGRMSRRMQLMTIAAGPRIQGIKDTKPGESKDSEGNSKPNRKQGLRRLREKVHETRGRSNERSTSVKVERGPRNLRESQRTGGSSESQGRANGTSRRINLSKVRLEAGKRVMESRVGSIPGGRAVLGEMAKLQKNRLIQGANDSLNRMQQRVYAAGKKTIKEDTQRIARAVTLGQLGKKKSKKEKDKKEKQEKKENITKRAGVRSRVNQSKRKKETNGKDGKKSKNGKKRISGTKIVRGAGKLAAGTYRPVSFGGESTEGNSTDEMASRMGFAIMLFAKFLALSILIINIIAKLILLIISTIICVIVVIVVNVSLLSIIVAIITAVVVAIIALFWSKHEEDGGGGGRTYVSERRLEDAFYELEDEYEQMINAYIPLSGYDGYRIEGEKAAFYDVLRVWVTVSPPDYGADIWVSPENLTKLREVYWKFNRIELTTESRMEPELTIVTDPDGEEQEVEVMVEKRIAVITATCIPREEVFQSYGITDELQVPVDHLLMSKAEEIYVQKISGKEYELPVGEVMFEKESEDEEEQGVGETEGLSYSPFFCGMIEK